MSSDRSASSAAVDLRQDGASVRPRPDGRRILLGSFDVPGHGGASTSTYSLFRRMLLDGLDVRLVNLVADRDLRFLRSAFGPSVGNPEALPGVETWIVEGRWAKADGRVRARIRELAPDVLLGVGDVAAHFLKSASGGRPLVFLTSGCRQAKKYLERVVDAVELERLLQEREGWPFEDPGEPEAVERADLIVTNSEATMTQFLGFYGRWRAKIHPEIVSFAQWILDDTRSVASLRRTFPEREIGVLFVANDWRRREKNGPLVSELARRLAKSRVHVVGDGIPSLPGVVHEGLVTDRERLFELMGNAKTVVSPC